MMSGISAWEDKISVVMRKFGVCLLKNVLCLFSWDSFCVGQAIFLMLLESSSELRFKPELSQSLVQSLKNIAKILQVWWILWVIQTMNGDAVTYHIGHCTMHFHKFVTRHISICMVVAGVSHSNLTLGLLCIPCTLLVHMLTDSVTGHMHAHYFGMSGSLVMCDWQTI